MVIKKLHMHNFGVYAGTNTFEFHGKKPVVLIGGMNGRGKTTFLEAVLLALYGASSFAYAEGHHSSYAQYLKNYVNREDGTNQSYIDLEFKVNPDDSETYLIHREWSAQGLRTGEQISATKNGEYSQFLTENWAMFIENILPSGLSSFFFFDGEKIAELAVESTSSQMKESIKALLGISVVDSLENDLRRILSKNIRLAQEGSDEHKLAELKSEKDAVEENLEKTDEEIANIQQQVDCETKALESKRAEYSSIGGDIVSQRQEMLHQKTVLTMQLDQINEDLITDASGDLPLALVQNLLWKIKGQAETAQNDKLNRLAIERINDFFEAYKAASSTDELDARQFVKFVSEQYPTSEAQSINLSDIATYQLRELLRQKLDADIIDAKKHLETRTDLQNKINEIEHYLAVEVDTQRLTELYSEISAAEKKIIELKAALRAAKEKRATLHGDVIRTTTAYNRFVEKYLKTLEVHDDGERIDKYIHQITSVLGEYRIRLQAQKIDVLAKTMTECYKRLADKKNLIEHIEMDENTLNLLYYNYDGNIVPKDSLSAGEKQLMVIALLWALGICSKKRLPVIIDTPLSRLDSNHRTALIKTYFPHASDQTIILSTDSEIDQHYYDLMKENVDDEYTFQEFKYHKWLFPGGVQMIVKQVKISNQSKERLSRLKGKTGIKNWNILCRWALCYSLSEHTVPTDLPIALDSNVEMSWYTFGGEYNELYEALVYAWCEEMGLPTDEDTVSKYFKLHLERGIAHLSGTNFIKSIDDLLRLGIEA